MLDWILDGWLLDERNLYYFFFLLNLLANLCILFLLKLLKQIFLLPFKLFLFVLYVATTRRSLRSTSFLNICTFNFDFRRRWRMLTFDLLFKWYSLSEDFREYLLHEEDVLAFPTISDLIQAHHTQLLDELVRLLVLQQNFHELGIRLQVALWGAKLQTKIRDNSLMVNRLILFGPLHNLMTNHLDLNLTHEWVTAYLLPRWSQLIFEIDELRVFWDEDCSIEILTMHSETFFYVGHIVRPHWDLHIEYNPRCKRVRLLSIEPDWSMCSEELFLFVPLNPIHVIKNN